MTRAEEALDKLERSIEQNIAALLHVHEVIKYEKTENGEMRLEITFSDGSIIEVKGEVIA